MEAYLDNAATTRVSPAVMEKMNQVFLTDFGNPSSMHKKGMEAELYIREAKKQIADCLKCEPSELIFTSGGTESNNMALIGTALANKRTGNHIITTRIEHASVYQPLLFLEELGFRVTFAPVDEAGRVIVDELVEAVGDDTILVSVMYVNNEIGSIEPVAEIAKKIKEKNPKLLFHVDAIQAFGKMKIQPGREGIDLLSVSGHKIHGPKGSGFLYVKNKTKIRPILHGGGQEKGMRSGTENVPAIAGLGQAAKDMYANLEMNRKHLFELKELLAERFSRLEGVTLNGIPEEGISATAPHVLSASFPGIRSEVLLHALEEKGVYVSSGSACSSNHPDISGTLVAIGVKKELLDATLRFSFSVTTTKEEVEYAADCVEELLPQLRRFFRK
ncbi:MAG: cysteine desulfurase [Lachnospiraceae bacterium]|nr:cysteine desulfurase [Lachnospiraceae bacterium]